MPINNPPKYTKIGIEFADGRTREAAKAADAGAYVNFTYLHYQLHQDQLRFLNNVTSGMLINNKVAYLFRVGAFPSDVYFDSFSFSGLGDFEIWREVSVTDENIGVNVPIYPMNGGGSKDFEIYAVKPTVPGGVKERNLITKYDNTQIGNINFGTPALKYYSEPVGEKGIPAAPSIKFPFELRVNTIYAIVVTARENGINITANIIFNQECCP